jgi:hypothetical protein
MGSNPSSCARARFLAALAPDRSLSDLEQRSLLRHLDRCADCRAFARSVADVARELRAAPKVSTSIAFSPPRRRSRRVLLAPVVTAATVAAALMLVTSAALRDPLRAPSPSGPNLIANAPVENEGAVIRRYRDLALARRLEPVRAVGQPGMYVG